MIFDTIKTAWPAAPCEARLPWLRMFHGAWHAILAGASRCQMPGHSGAFGLLVGGGVHPDRWL